MNVLTTLSSYRLIASDLPRSLTTVAKRPEINREVEYYLQNIGQVTSISDFLSDNRLFTFAMKAFGLGDMAYAKAFVKKLLSEGTDRPQSFANRLTDSRYRELAQTFDFPRLGPATTSFRRAQQDVVDAYIRQALEEDAGSKNEGVRLALYFQRKAPNLTSTYGILADPALLKVAQIALGWPSSASAMNVDRQAEELAKRVNTLDFRDPAKLQRFIDRFLSLWELSKPVSSHIGGSYAIGSPNGVAISPEVLAGLQNLRSGKGGI